MTESRVEGVALLLCRWEEKATVGVGVMSSVAQDEVLGQQAGSGWTSGSTWGLQERGALVLSWPVTH